jgi:membrane associated rhomboid family serine protease
MSSPLRFQFPPNTPEEAGPTYRSRLYERFGDLLPVVTYSVTLWCVVVYFLLNRDHVGNAGYELAHMLGLTTRQDLADGRWWGPVATTCIHFNLWHIAFNMLWLVRLGSLMERGLGSLKTLAFFIAAAFVSSTLQLVLDGPGIGFSGVVYALGGFVWGAWPRYTGFLEGFTGSSLRWLLFWQALCFLLSWGGMMPIGNTAHISGMIFGFLVGLWACRGTRQGWPWLTAALVMLAGSVALVAAAALT